MPARALVPALALLGGTLLWVLFGAASVVNYDTLYAVVWGDQLLHGHAASFTAPGAPTPHPLLTLAGLLAAALGGSGSAGAFSLLAYLGYVATAATGVLLAVVARRSLGAAAAAVALVLWLTREPVLSYGLRAYIDLPYLALLLLALALELGRPRRGAPVLMALLLAGLLRPEAWLLSGLYLLYLWRDPEGARLPPLRLIALAGAAPVLWLATDLLLTGDLLFSFNGTRAGTERLERPTGLSGLLTIAPRRIGEILREDGLLGAVLGAALLARQRTPQRLAIVVAGLAAAGAFALVALGGLPVIVRYLLPVAALGALAYAFALTGWRADPSIRGGRLWIAAAALLALVSLALVPRQVHRLDRLQATLAAQQAATDELRLLVDKAPCGPIAVPNRRAVPLVALWTGARPESVITTQDQGVPARGSYLVPASQEAADAFILDRRDTERTIPPVPPSWKPVARTERWVLASNCGARR